MNVKSTIACLFMASCSLILQAQKNDLVEIKWGDEIPLPKKHSRFGFAGDLNQGFVQITQIPKKEVGFARISNKLKYEDSKSEALPKSKYAMFESLVQIDDRAYVLISDYDKANQSEKLLVREVDIKNGGFKGEPEEVLTTTGKVTGTIVATGFYSFSTTDKFKVVVPDGGDRILVFYRLKPTERRDSKNFDKIVYNVFDRRWKLQWSKEVTMPHTEADMNIIAHNFVKDEVYAFCRVKSGAIDPETKRAEFDELSVIVINESDKKPKEYPLEVAGKHVREITFGRGKGSSILIAGYLKPSRKANTYTGYFTSVFNPETKQIENVNSFTFREDLISAFESERTKRKLEKSIAKGKDPGIPNLEMRAIIQRPDGGWYVVGEQYYFYTVTVSNGKTTYTTYHYLYMDAIISSVGSDGVEDWTIKVPKNQHYINSTYGAGIDAFEYENNLYIFNLDHVKNKKLDESATPVTFNGSFKDAAFFCTRLTPDGNRETETLFDIRDEGKVIIPGAIEQMQPGVLMSAGRKNAYFSGRTNIPSLIYLK